MQQQQPPQAHGPRPTMRFDPEPEHEAAELIKLIAAEFNSDPMSVACFDLRTVERVKACAAQLK